VITNGENPRGEYVLTGGGNDACLVYQLLRTAHNFRL